MFSCLLIIFPKYWVSHIPLLDFKLSWISSSVDTFSSALLQHCVLNGFLLIKFHIFFVRQNLCVVFTQSEIYVSLGSWYYLSWLALTGLISLYFAVLEDVMGDFTCSWIGFSIWELKTSPRYKKEILGSRARQGVIFSELTASFDWLPGQLKSHSIGIKLSSGQFGTEWRTPPRCVRDISGSLVTPILIISYMDFQSNISPWTSYPQFSIYNV